LEALKSNLNIKTISAINPSTGNKTLIFDRLNPDNNATIVKYIGEDGVELVKFKGK